METLGYVKSFGLALYIIKEMGIVNKLVSFLKTFTLLSCYIYIYRK